MKSIQKSGSRVSCTSYNFNQKGHMWFTASEVIGDIVPKLLQNSDFTTQTTISQFMRCCGSVRELWWVLSVLPTHWQCVCTVRTTGSTGACFEVSLILQAALDFQDSVFAWQNFSIGWERKQLAWEAQFLQCCLK
jgi:hypothetical protein